MIEKYLCTKDFKMDGGQVAFKKGKVYDFILLPPTAFDGEAHFKCVVNELGSKNHYMPESDMTSYFSKVTDLNNLQENDMEQYKTEQQLEAEVVKAWFGKVNWLVSNTDISSWSSLEVVNEVGYSLYNKDCVDFVINSYNDYKDKEKDKEKQKLLDKRAELELQLTSVNNQLAEINKQLGE